MNETLDLAINLEQSLIDAELNREQDRAISLAVNPQFTSALTSGTGLTDVLDRAKGALPTTDLLTAVDSAGVVRGRAGSANTGDRLDYGGLVDRVLSAGAPVSSIAMIPGSELTAEPGNTVAQLRLPVVATEGATDARAGTILEDGLALVGAAPVRDRSGQVIGAVVSVDLLNNDHSLVDAVTSRSPQGMPMHATIALDGIRVATTVPAPGGSRRAVGTLYSDAVMTRLRSGQEYRGRALVGGWQWEQTIYLPLTDHGGRVVAGSFVGVPEENFAALTQWTAISTRVALAVAVAGLSLAVLLADRLARRSIVHPLARFTEVLQAGDLQSRIVAEQDEETARLAEALNAMTGRIRRTVAEVGGVAEGVRAVSETLATEARQTAADAARALEVARHALEAAETVSAGTSRAAGRMRELELALTRIDAGTEEQARAIRHAGSVVMAVSGAIDDSRGVLAAVLESTRTAVTAAQQGRHSALRTVAALELIRLAIPAEGPLQTDLQRGQAAADDCDALLRDISREADDAKNQLLQLAGALHESGARAGAVTSQLADISAVVDETAQSSRTMSAASREIIGEVESMAAATKSALSLVREARTHMTSITVANQRLLDLSERSADLALELDTVTSQFPRL